MKTSTIFAAFIAAFTLAACQTPPAQTFAEITWQHTQKIAFNVGTLETASQVTPSIDPPHVGHLFPAPPLETARRWGQDRLAAGGGGTGSLRYTILKADATETKIAVDESVGDYFVNEQSERYDVEIAVEVAVLNEAGRVIAGVRANSALSRTVPEDIKLAEREKVWFEMVDSVMKDINTRLEREIRAKLKAYLLYG